MTARTFIFVWLPIRGRGSPSRPSNGTDMPLRKGYSRSIIRSNIREFHTGDTYAHTASKFGKKDADRQAVAVALETARRAKRKRADGGGIFDYGGVGAAMPENIAAEAGKTDPVTRAVMGIPKRMLWDLPHESVEAAQQNPMPGLRREDYTDIPGRGQPVDPMVAASGETALNMAG